MFIYHTSAKYVPATNMPIKCDIYAPYELTDQKHCTRAMMMMMPMQDDYDATT